MKGNWKQLFCILVAFAFATMAIGAKADYRVAIAVAPVGIDITANDDVAAAEALIQTAIIGMTIIQLFEFFNNDGSQNQEEKEKKGI